MTESEQRLLELIEASERAMMGSAERSVSFWAEVGVVVFVALFFAALAWAL